MPIYAVWQGVFSSEVFTFIKMSGQVFHYFLCIMSANSTVSVGPLKLVKMFYFVLKYTYFTSKLLINVEQRYLTWTRSTKQQTVAESAGLALKRSVPAKPHCHSSSAVSQLFFHSRRCQKIGATEKWESLARSKSHPLDSNIIIAPGC